MRGRGWISGKKSGKKMWGARLGCEKQKGGCQVWAWSVRVGDPGDDGDAVGLLGAAEAVV